MGFSAGVVSVALAVSGAVSAGAVDLAAEAVVDTAAPAAVYSDAQYPQDGAAGKTFKDVPTSAAFAREIGWLAASGVSTGWPDGTFKPITAVNRDAMAAFMYRLAGKPAFTPPKVSPFMDVAPGYLFYKEITWLAAEGISTGWAEPGNRRSFRPVQPVNRDAMAAFMYRLAGKPAPPASTGTRFRDVPAGRAFSTEIGWLASTGVSTGWADGTFRPLQAVNRDAMAAFMYRFLVRARPFAAGTASTVHLGPLATGHNAGLVRLSVKDAKDAVTVSVTGAPALTVPSGTSASTTVLAPLINGAVAVSASNDTQVTIQLIATFDGAGTVPGSTIALPAPVTRADTDRQLAGSQLSAAPFDVGLTGTGGVPASEVRAVFVTATVTLAAPDVLRLDDQDLTVGAGVTSITTMLLPSEAGTARASLRTGTGSLRMDVRGYVTDAAQEAPNVNVGGSFVPASAPTPQKFTATSAGTPIPLKGPAGSEAALMLVSAESAGAATSVLDVAPGSTPGVGGAVIDAGRGAQPQLAFIPLRKGQPTARIGAGSAAAVALPLGTLLSAPPAASGPAPEVSITSPASSATVDLGETGKLVLEGTVASSTAHVAAMLVTVGGAAVGTPKVQQTAGGIRWSFETGLPQSGQVSFTVSATDRAGHTGSSSVLVNAVLPTVSTQIISPDAVQLDEAVNPVQSVTPTSVTVANSPDLAVGQIIVEGPSAAAPDGLLRQVSAVDQVGSSTVATTTPATLADVFLQVDFSQEVPLDSSRGLATAETGADGDNSPGLTVQDEGIAAATVETGSDVSLDTYTDTATSSWTDAEVVPLNAAPARMTAQSLRPAGIAPLAVTIDESLQFASHIALKDTITCDAVKGCLSFGKTPESTIQKAKATIASSAGVSLSGEAKVGFTLTFTLRTNLHWGWGGPQVQIEEFSTIVHTEMSAKATASAFLKTATNNRMKHELATLKMAPITFMVLTIPVVIRPGGTVYLEANFSAATSLTVDLGVERSQDFGVRYSSNGGFRSVDTGPVTKFSTPVFGPNGTAAVTGKIEAGFGPTLKASLLIYGFAGPTLTIGAQAGASASITMATTGNRVDASLYIRGDVIIGVELTVPIIEKKLLDAVIVSGNYTWRIKTWQWDYATTFPGADLPAEAPKLSITNTQLPQGTAGRTYSVQLSATGGTAPYSWRVSLGTLPAGLRLDAATGTISGTPTAEGTRSVTVAVADSEGAETQTVLPISIAVSGAFSEAQVVAGGWMSRVALKNDGTVWQWGGRQANNSQTGSLFARQVSGIADVRLLRVLNRAVYAIKTDGSLWFWGSDPLGRSSATPVKVEGLSAVADVAGLETVFAIRTDGSVWAWGQNETGLLGDGTVTARSTPIPVAGATAVRSISSDGRVAVAIRTDGSLLAWGENYFGQLGDGTTTDSRVPNTVVGPVGVNKVAINGSALTAIGSDGAVWCWGDSTMAPFETTQSTQLAPRLVEGLPAIEDAVMDGSGTLALAKDGTVWAWGSNQRGQRATPATTLRDFTPNKVDGLGVVQQIASLDMSAFAVGIDGTVWAWGRNDGGRLGVGGSDDSYLPRKLPGLAGTIRVDVAPGGGAAILDGGYLWTWGGNSYGELGNGTTVAAYSPVQVRTEPVP
ncbi:S-layer homology domain-containing protein [Arthrobacter globiformis]|uniref:S-layer homology domain-containing protein n=1 Tax=Arthrobacter globiformis TaxID=1665 RepID=UPI0027D86BBF|nr:S-layer homology domain-containing protein [Arthrobacter globiformis]